MCVGEVQTCIGEARCAPKKCDVRRIRCVLSPTRVNGARSKFICIDGNRELLR
jgi:hypothetical protein